MPPTKLPASFSKVLHTHGSYFLNRNVFRRWEGRGSNREDSNIMDLLHMYLMAYPAPLLKRVKCFHKPEFARNT